MQESYLINKKYTTKQSLTKYINDHIKGLAIRIGINPDISTNSARHTFATTITLAKGVSIEIVALMLGHTRLTTTQHYAKLVNGKLFYETGKLHDIYR